MWEKGDSCFENRLSGVKKTVRCFRVNIPKNQRELNGIEVMYISVVVVLIFTLSFFNYSNSSILFYFFTLDFFR